mgnify:CR=1 FL=1
MSKNNNRIWVCVLFGISAVMVLLLWLAKPKRASQFESTTQAASHDNKSRIRNPSSYRQTVENRGQELRTREEYIRQSRSEWLANHKTPILFYGKVLDQHDQPVGGVNVYYRANAVNDSLTKQEYPEGKAVSDSSGIFKIDGIHGATLSFELLHPDYYNSTTNRTGIDYAEELNRGVPNSESRAMVFRIFKKQNPVPLIFWRSGFQLPHDGTSKVFSLRGKTKTELIGQIQVQAWADRPNLYHGGAFDWKIRLTVSEGGVLEAKHEFDFIAPDSGYQDFIEFSVSKNDPNWQPSADKRFFLKMSNYFVRADAHFEIWKDLSFTMEYFINPNGSQNLEFDPEAQPNQTHFE